MSTKTQKLLTLIGIGVLAAIGWFVYKRYLQSEQSKQMEKFQNALGVWMAKIRQAHQVLTPGWEGWYIPEGPARQAALGRVKSAALWQIRIHEPHLIPAGYEIAETAQGGSIQLGLLQKI